MSDEWVRLRVPPWVHPQLTFSQYRSVKGLADLGLAGLVPVLLLDRDSLIAWLPLRRDAFPRICPVGWDAGADHVRSDGLIRRLPDRCSGRGPI